MRIKCACVYIHTLLLDFDFHLFRMYTIFFGSAVFCVFSTFVHLFCKQDSSLFFVYLFYTVSNIYGEKILHAPTATHIIPFYSHLCVSFLNLLGKQNIHLIRSLELLYKFLTLTKKLHTFCQVFT